MKNFKFYCFAIIAIVLVCSCQKEESQKSEEKSKEASQVQFFASYNETPHTKGSASFTTGNKATIYAVKAAAVPSITTFVKGTPLEATALAGGALSPVSELFVPKGLYDFYSVSLNSNTVAGLTFAAGVSAQLSNNIDYLWAKAPNVSEGGTVIFSYNHKAVAIEIDVTAGVGVTVLNVTSIKITPSKPSASSTINLATGEIGAATEKDALTETSLTSNKGSLIMLPLNSTSLNIEVVVDATIGGTAVTNKKYTASIPATKYSGGTYYKLNLSVDAKAITFSGAQLTDWTTQTISGVTLIEQ